MLCREGCPTRKGWEEISVTFLLLIFFLGRKMYWNYILKGTNKYVDMIHSSGFKSDACFAYILIEFGIGGQFDLYLL